METRVLPRSDTQRLLLWMAVLLAGCSGGKKDSGLFGDGAGSGLSKSERVEPAQETVLRLKNGAALHVPEGALETASTLKIERPDDARAARLTSVLKEDKARLASAPHVLTPHGQNFKKPVTVTLPVEKESRDRRLLVLYAADEEAVSWKVLTTPGIEDGGATFQTTHFSVMALVEDDGTFEAPDPGQAPMDAGTVCASSSVDLLFVIDNSGSMAARQRKLVEELPLLMRQLAKGVAGPPGIASIHAGVVSTDLGINGAPAVDGCGERSFEATERDTFATNTSRVLLDKPRGDDAVLSSSNAVALDGIWGRSLTNPGGSVELLFAPDPTCAAVPLRDGARYASYPDDGASLDDAGHALACIARLGRNGCAFEQQLEAMLKALTPAQATPRFTAYQGDGVFGEESAGHGGEGGANAGFLREEAVLVVVVVSDEEDCSIPDRSRGIFNPADGTFAANVSARCALHPDALHPITRYAEGLRALKADADRVVFAALVGAPRAESGEVYRGQTALEALLEHPEMQYREASQNAGLQAACTGEDGAAYPARRIAQLAAQFGDNGVLGSICDPTFGPFMARVVELAASRVASGCEREAQDAATAAP
jgi:hypothetical protein